MAECETAKEKYLYVLGIEHGEKFFNGRRALSSVLRTATLRSKFNKTFGDQYKTVRDYYLPRKGRVLIQDELASKKVNLYYDYDIGLIPSHP